MLRARRLRESGDTVVAIDDLNAYDSPRRSIDVFAGRHMSSDFNYIDDLADAIVGVSARLPEGVRPGAAPRPEHRQPAART
jgi:hypothetical protein